MTYYSMCCFLKSCLLNLILCHKPQEPAADRQRISTELLESLGHLLLIILLQLYTVSKMQFALFMFILSLCFSIHTILKQPIKHYSITKVQLWCVMLLHLAKLKMWFFSKLTQLAYNSPLCLALVSDINWPSISRLPEVLSIDGLSPRIFRGLSSSPVQ